MFVAFSLIAATAASANSQEFDFDGFADWQAHLPPECKRDAVGSSEQTVQRCLTTLNHGRPLPFNCSQRNRLVASFGEPFAAGQTKEAFSGVFNGAEPVRVVVKRARQRFRNGHPPPHSAGFLVDEAILMVLLRAPVHVDFLGHCANGLDSLNVVRFATPWKEVVPDRGRMSLAARVDAASQMVDMLQWWSQSPAGALVHCDMHEVQFAFHASASEGRFRPVLVDLDGLRPVRRASPSCSAQTPQTCYGHCFKGPHYAGREFGFPHERDMVAPAEASCVNGSCGGFDSAFNVYTVCRVMFFRLFLMYNKPGVVPRLLRRNVRWLLDECDATDPRDRPSLERLRAMLADLAALVGNQSLEEEQR